MTFRAVEQAEAAQADFVVCFRLKDAPPISAYPKAVQAEVAAGRQVAIRQPCESCGETILAAPDNPPGIPRICTHCHNKVQELAKRATMGRA